jgi:hypothetical protein
MWRSTILLLALVACDEGTKSKAKDAVKKVDNAVDKFEAGDVKERLDKAKSTLASGTEPHEECSWVARATDTDATKAQLDELRKLCNVDVPLNKAAQAVARAEKARSETPDAPSLTECQSDDWAQTKSKIEGSPLASESKWTDLKARWAKACPDQK